MRSLPSRAQIQERLGVIFPRSAFDPVHSNPLAAAALAAMLYIDALSPMKVTRRRMRCGRVLPHASG